MSDEEIRRKPAAERTVGFDEPSTSKDGKKTNLRTGDFLKRKHPELFKFSPRPGGFYPHLSARLNVSGTVVEDGGSRNKPKRTPSTRTNLNIEPRASIGEILETNIRCPSSRTHVSRADQKNYTVRMCSIAISTVMMLAQKTYDDITAEHVRHSEEYFRSLKQADGYPRNVEILVHLLTNLKMSGKIVTPVAQEDEVRIDNDDEEEEEEEEETESDERAQMSHLIN